MEKKARASQRHRRCYHHSTPPQPTDTPTRHRYCHHHDHSHRRRRAVSLVRACLPVGRPIHPHSSRASKTRRTTTVAHARTHTHTRRSVRLLARALSKTTAALRTARKNPTRCLVPRRNTRRRGTTRCYYAAVGSSSRTCVCDTHDRRRRLLLKRYYILTRRVICFPALATVRAHRRRRSKRANLRFARVRYGFVVRPPRHLCRS